MQDCSFRDRDPSPSGCKNGICRPDNLPASIILADDAETAIFISNKINRKKVFNDFYIGIALDFFYKCFSDNPSCVVAVSVNYPRMRMAAFDGFCNLTINLVELRPPFKKLFYQSRPLPDNLLYRLLFTQTAAGLYCICNMRFDTIIVIQDNSYPPCAFQVLLSLI